MIIVIKSGAIRKTINSTFKQKQILKLINHYFNFYTFRLKFGSKIDA